MVLALSTYMIQAQEYGVYSMHFVRIEGNTDDFEKSSICVHAKSGQGS